MSNREEKEFKWLFYPVTWKKRTGGRGWGDKKGEIWKKQRRQKVYYGIANPEVGPHTLARNRNGLIFYLGHT